MYDILCLRLFAPSIWYNGVVRLASAVRGPLAGAEAGRGCAGEQPSCLASGVSSDEGVPRGRTPRSAVRFSAGARLQMENHRTVAELSLWARVAWLGGLRCGPKKLPASTEGPCRLAGKTGERGRDHGSEEKDRPKAADRMNCQTLQEEPYSTSAQTVDREGEIDGDEQDSRD